MNKKLIVVVILISLFFIISANASVNYLHDSLKTNYSSGEKITGKINFNIANNPADARFSSNFDGNITLLEIIRDSGFIEGTSYTCSIEGCGEEYAEKSAIGQLNVVAGTNYFTGFRVDGPGITITDSSVVINSNSPSSCSPNLYVDLLADGLDIITSNKAGQESCGVRHVGCYNSLNTDETAIVSGKEYCEKIRIPAAPAMILGGKIRKGAGPSNLTMKLYDFNTAEFLDSCKLGQNSQNIEDLNCVVNRSSTEPKDYYVCITTNTNNNYKIGAETSSPTCGTALGFSSLNSDFDLFAETLTYAAMPSISLDQTTYKKYTSKNITLEIDGYIQENYNSECQDSSCFIPIKLSGSLNQLLSFDNPRIEYESVGLTKSNQQFYELESQTSKISANNLSFDISKANFVIPINSNDNKFKLYLDNNLIFEKPISVKKGFVFDVTPKIVAFGQNTKFTVISSSNITQTIWNFGDGTSIQTENSSSTVHTFTKLNSTYFDINVTAIGTNQTRATVQFRIFVGNPKEIANITIAEYKKRIINVSNKTDTYPAWVAVKLKEVLDLNNLETKLNSLERKYVNATTEEDYQKIMLDLIALDVPRTILTTSSANNAPLSIGYDGINVNYIEEISNKDISDNDLLKNKITDWMDSNYNPQISFSKIEKIKEFSNEPIMTLFTLKTNPKGSFSTESYLIFGQDVFASGLYKSNYNHLVLSSGSDYVLVDSSSSQTFEFLIEGDIDVEILGAYISPQIQYFGNIEPPSGNCNLNNICESDESAQTCPEDCEKGWFKFTIIGWVFLSLIAFVAYLILQEWYKSHYQNSLFPNDNDFYNLINFIYNARKSGIKDSEARNKLKEQKWSKERIDFAFKKIDGKRTGMFEIPLFKGREQKKVANEIAKRQPGGSINARFIKRPSYRY